MVMALEFDTWTRQRVLDLPDDGMRHELIDGEHIVTPSPSHWHQDVLGWMHVLIRPYVTSQGIGRTFCSPSDVNQTGDELLQPDLYVVKGRERPRGHAQEGALFLVVEVLSPSTARYDRGIKRRRYQRGGVDEYWVVDLDARLVERWRPGDDRPELAAQRLSWHPVGASVPLVLDLGAMFEECLE